MKVTLACGISIDFTDKLNEPYRFVGTFAYIVDKYKNGRNEDIRDSAIIEIENRAINYAHKVFAGYIKRVAMADEAVKLLIKKISE